MSPEEKRDAIMQFVTKAGPQSLDRIFAAVAAEEAKPVPPALWTDRTPGWNKPTGQKASPALWIKMHYGNKDTENWDAMGLTRDMLRQIDRPPYQAFSTYISRLSKDTAKTVPSDLFPLLETLTSRVTTELQEAGITHPKQAREKLPDNPDKVDRLRSAARYRVLTNKLP